MLRADMSNFDKKLINIIELNIKPTRAPDTFYLLVALDDNILLSRF